MAEPDVTFAALDPDVEDRLQPLRRLLGVTSFGVSLVVLQPRQRMRVHTHERQEEVYVVLEGELTLRIEDAEHTLRAGEVARIGPQTRRQLVNAGSGRVLVLAIGGAGDHQSRDALVWPAWEDRGPGRQPRDVPLPPDLP